MAAFGSPRLLLLTKRFLSSSAPPTTTSTTTTSPLLRVSWLDLRASGLSILERLLLEECLLRHDDRNWLIAGTHEASRHRHLRLREPTYISNAKATSIEDVNTGSAIVLGLGGKPLELLDTELVKREGCMCIKRFTGGGTVVLDSDSIWTTLIFRPDTQHEDLPETFPRPIMEWSANRIFGPLFEALGEQQRWKGTANRLSSLGRQTLILDTKSCAVENTGRLIRMKSSNNNEEQSSTQLLSPSPPLFALRENDYVLGEHKMGGNAQSITSKGWLHHTSFLWDYQDENMAYLTLPGKQPEYRRDRKHSDFLVKLSKSYPNLSKSEFIKTMAQVTGESFQLENVVLRDAMQVVENQGGLQSWFEKGSRTRILTDLV